LWNAPRPPPSAKADLEGYPVSVEDFHNHSMCGVIRETLSQDPHKENCVLFFTLFVLDWYESRESIALKSSFIIDKQITIGKHKKQGYGRPSETNSDR
jgi:hypothetical protein